MKANLRTALTGTVIAAAACLAVAAPSYAHWGPWSAGAVAPSGSTGSSAWKTCSHSSPTRTARVRITNIASCFEGTCAFWSVADYQNVTSANVAADILAGAWDNGGDGLG